MKAIINLLNISLLVLSLTSSAISKDREGKFFLLSFLKGFFLTKNFLPKLKKINNHQIFLRGQMKGFIDKIKAVRLCSLNSHI